MNVYAYFVDFIPCFVYKLKMLIMHACYEIYVRFLCTIIPKVWLFMGRIGGIPSLKVSYGFLA